MFGSLKGGEGFFKRPTGIAIDRETHEIYVTDTLRDRVYVLDARGTVLRSIGQHGDKNGEFNFPTELLVKNGVLAVVDAMNFRVQTFDLKGTYQSTIGSLGDSSGAMFRPKGIGLDSENHIYLVEGMWGSVQVFDREGQLLYTFGERGTALGQFQLPTGLFIDRNDRVYVADSYNHRVQIFQYHGVKTAAIRGEAMKVRLLVLVLIAVSVGMVADADRRCAGRARSLHERHLAHPGLDVGCLPVLSRAALGQRQERAVGANPLQPDLLHLRQQHRAEHHGAAAAGRGTVRCA